MRLLDFTPLASSVSVSDVRAYNSTIVNKIHIARYVFFAVGSIFTLSLVGLALAFILEQDTGLTTNWMPLGIVGLFCVALIGMAIAWFFQQRTLVRLQRFSDKNGLTLSVNKTPFSFTGMLFDNGDDRVITSSLSFPEGYEIGNYRYETGSGKSRSTHNYGFIRVALSRHLPNMVLDSRRDNFLGISSLPDSIDKSQKLELEGDFNEYFNLYVPKQYERDALYVFTPDVMQAVIQHGQFFDIEIVDDEMYMYTKKLFKLESQQDLEQAIKSIEAIASELRQQTRRYSDERVTENTNGASVAKEGRRLKQSFSWFTVIFILAYILSMFKDVLFIDNKVIGIAIVICILIVASVLVGIVVKRSKR